MRRIFFKGEVQDRKLIVPVKYNPPFRTVEKNICLKHFGDAIIKLRSHKVWVARATWGKREVRARRDLGNECMAFDNSNSFGGDF